MFLGVGFSWILWVVVGSFGFRVYLLGSGWVNVEGMGFSDTLWVCSAVCGLVFCGVGWFGCFARVELGVVLVCPLDLCLFQGVRYGGLAGTLCGFVG